jgi:hypothetical protein
MGINRCHQQRYGRKQRCEQMQPMAHAGKRDGNRFKYSNRRRRVVQWPQRACNGAKGAIGAGLSVAENTLSGSTLLGTQVSGEGPGLSKVFDSVWQSSSGEIYYVESKFGTGLAFSHRHGN